MDKFNSKIHQRKSIRLKEYDYSTAGFYFVTICIQDKACLLAEIVSSELLLNDAGQMVETWYYELEQKFKTIKCHELVVMPNHLHFIIEIIGSEVKREQSNVGADLCVCPSSVITNKKGEHAGLPLQLSTDFVLDKNTSHSNVNSSLSEIIKWFKTMTTNAYIRGVKEHNWQPFAGKLWQRNYWEHVIRSEESYQEIAKYIIENPIKWELDELNPKNI